MLNCNRSEESLLQSQIALVVLLLRLSDESLNHWSQLLRSLESCRDSLMSHQVSGQVSNKIGDENMMMMMMMMKGYKVLEKVFFGVWDRVAYLSMALRCFGLRLNFRMFCLCLIINKII